MSTWPIMETMLDEVKKAKYYIYVISDATDETAETVTLAALSQFKKKDIIISRIGNVRTDDHIRSILKKAKHEGGWDVYHSRD